jgi:transcriptional regulator with XRE-family HTH domain
MATAANSPLVTEESARTLRRLRLDAGLTQPELAARAGVSVWVISRAEQGATPRPAAQLAIARVFELRPSDLWPPQS